MTILSRKTVWEVQDTIKENVIFNGYTELDEVKDIVCSIMENAFKLSVPLKVDIEIGDNWYEAK